ncbi:SpoIIE family protein phosphatase [Streptomyces thermolilacinus]|uniref:protein-serine/threonine phosphatase n=1 Tax=Streptomyces thermolilacinus SPC6 TaxID=1306406 RepID=A0A1D3DYV8_9ACTN|nr:SpoIIE family protein phosphatase [Streptomyces thermolilacinus]OEJ97512.1 protein phosphatase [Streptomyces thermolilacinus SPC6]
MTGTDRAPPAAQGVDTDLRGPLDVARAATAVLDGDGTVIGWGPAAQRLLGHTPGEVLGRPVGALLVDDRPGDHQGGLLRTRDRRAAVRRTGDPLAADPPAGAGLPGSARVRRQVLRLRHRDGRVVRVVAATLPLSSHGDTGPDRLLVIADAEETERWEALQSMLRGLATQSPVGLAIYDTDLRVVWTNSALCEEMGTSQYAGLGPDDMVAAGEILSPGHPPTLEETMRRVLATGEAVTEVHYRGRPPVDPDHDHVWSCSYYRLADADGTRLGVCEETVDITDRYLAQQRLDLLVRAGGVVGTTLDMSRTARELSSVAVPQFADGVTVDLVDAVLRGEPPTPGTTGAGRLVRVWATPGEGPPAGRHATGTTPGAPAAPDGTGPVRGTGTAPDPGARPVPDGTGPVPDDARPERARPGPEPVPYPPDAPQARCLATGRPVLTDGPAATLVVPLRTEGAPLGVVTFHREGRPVPFDTDDLPVADELVARTAVCIDNARRFTREHTAALSLQHSLLPRNLPRLTAVDFAHRYLPADSKSGVGGDWFDVITLSGARVGLVVGDVVGHGLGAAATMGRLRTSVRVLARQDLAPDELLTRLDDLIAQAADEEAATPGSVTGAVPPGPARGPDDIPDDQAVGATCLYAVYDPVTGVCRMARAGHPAPAVLDAAHGTVTVPDVPGGPPLGLGGLPFETTELHLPEGSLVALFTNGLVHGRARDSENGLDELSALLADHQGRPLPELCDRAVTALLPGPFEDDAALLLVRTRLLSADRIATWDLGTGPEEVGRARALAARRATDWGLGELAFTTEIVVSELVTNAQRYASGPVQLRLIQDRTLICEVSDTGHTAPHLRRAAMDDEGGRGLFLVAQMTQHWGTRYTATGKTIWAEQALPPP